MNDQLYKGFTKQKCLVMAVGYFYAPDPDGAYNANYTADACMWYWLLKYESGL